MEIFWTSNKSINGLRHFVLVNKIREKDQIKFLMVSVIDVEISLKISYKELTNSEKWNKGWLNLSKSQSITKDYLDYKSGNIVKEEMIKIFVNNNSLFNIS